MKLRGEVVGIETTDRGLDKTYRRVTVKLWGPGVIGETITIVVSSHDARAFTLDRWMDLTISLDPVKRKRSRKRGA